MSPSFLQQLNSCGKIFLLCVKEVAVVAKTIKCPKCKSTNVNVLGNDRKGFSAGKALGGALLTGGIGLLAGFAGKKGKYEVFCGDCGKRWKVK